jgi:hypothetical protein
VRYAEMAPKDFLLLAADQADEVVIVDRSAHRDGGLRFGWLGLLSTKGTERLADCTDQIAQVGHGDGVSGDVGDDDLRGEPGERARLFRFSLPGMFSHGSASA